MHLVVVILAAILCCCFLNAEIIRLANGISLDTKKRNSLLNPKQMSINHIKYLKYGFKESKTSQFFIQLKEGRQHSELSKILGEAEGVIESNLGIWTTSLINIQQLDPSLVDWVGFFKPHYKFPVVNPENKKKPWDILQRPTKKESFNFRFLVSNTISPSLSLHMRNDFVKSFKQWSEMQKFNRYEVKITGLQGSSVFGLEIFPKENPNTLELHFVFDEVFRFFAERPEITYIERQLPLVLHNREAAIILSSNYRTITGSINDLIYRNGIKGTDQVVCVADTGLFRLCFSFGKSYYLISFV